MRVFFNYHATRYPGLEISIKFETIAIKWRDTARKIRIRPFSQFQRHSLFLFLDIHRPGLLYRSRLAFQRLDVETRIASHRIASHRRTTNVRIKVAVPPSPPRERERETSAFKKSPAKHTVPARQTWPLKRGLERSVELLYFLFLLPRFLPLLHYFQLQRFRRGSQQNWENFQGHSMERRISNVITDRFLLVCLGIDPG